jgi:DNA-binding protein
MRRILDNPVYTAIAVAVLIFIPIFLVTFFWDFVSSNIFPNTKIGLYDRAFWENILVELHGMMIELVVVGVLVVWLDSRRKKNVEVTRLTEDLEDFAMLDSPEINIKKMGHLKRLNDIGVQELKVRNLVLNKIKIKDITLLKSNIIGLKVNEGTIYNTTFKEVSMRSSSFIKTIIKNTTFENCTLLNSKFTEGTCKGVSFKGSSVEYADFSDCNLQSAIFINSDVRGVKLQGANLKQCTFIGAKNIDINEIAKARCIDHISISDVFLDELKLLRPDMKYQRRNEGRAERN